MICPHCNYEHGFCNDKLIQVEGNKGDFFFGSVSIGKGSGFFETIEKKTLFACPNCGKTFIKV